MNDIDTIIYQLGIKHPQWVVTQLNVTHEADDNGLWFITKPDSDAEIQLESSSGNFPFLVESTNSNHRITATDVEATIQAIEAALNSTE
ncbi:MAG: hypothetical protein COA78_11530 [Blastopirellula sp.]|nr:MAG: hypothetical protein COA78_11530 [Blastopirellula sp.]